MNKRIQFTDNQIRLIGLALQSAIQLHRDFLMHDDWTHGMDKKNQKEVERAHKDLIKASSIFFKKCELKNG